MILPIVVFLGVPEITPVLGSRVKPSGRGSEFVAKEKETAVPPFEVGVRGVIG